MRGFVRAGFLAVSAAIVSLVLVSPTSAALPDASCPGPENSLVDLSGDVRIGETFKASHTGTVTNASVVIDKESAGADFLVQLRRASPVSQRPSLLLGSVTIPDASVPMGTSTQAVSLGTAVRRNSTYALVVTRPGGGPASLGERDDNACAGREVSSPTQTGPWSLEGPEFDLVFQVTVEPSNQFTVRSVLRRKITVNVPGPGSLIAQEARQRRRSEGKLRPKLVKTVQVETTGSATGGSTFVILPMRLTRAGKQALEEKRPRKARVLVTYTPTGGQPNTVQVGVPLRVPTRKR